MPPTDPTKPKGPVTWEAFFERLKTIYWPSLAPEARLETRPNPPPGEPAVPDDLWQAALVVFPDAEGWLHNPVPQLGGRTPLQAIDKKQIEQVKQLVMGVADFFLPDPSEVVPWEEYAAAVEAEQRAQAEAAEQADDSLAGE